MDSHSERHTEISTHFNLVLRPGLTQSLEFDFNLISLALTSAVCVSTCSAEPQMNYCVSSIMLIKRSKTLTTVSLYEAPTDSKTCPFATHIKCQQAYQ